MTTRRVSQSDLEAIVARINRMTGSPATSWTKDAAGRMASNIGNYHLDYAYGGVSLHRMANTAGGVHDVLRIGHVSKRELQGAMFAFICGLDTEEQRLQVAP
jgi:hypothetical protein